MRRPLPALCLLGVLVACGSKKPSGQGGSTCHGPAASAGGFGARSDGIGVACSASSPCAAGEICQNPGQTGSFCYKDCTFDASICPGDSICVPLGGPSYCLRACNTQASGSCGQASLVCNPVGPNTQDPGVCIPACASDADCGSFTCQTTGALQGVCVCLQDLDCEASSPGSNLKCDTKSGSCYEPCTDDALCIQSGMGGCCGAGNMCEALAAPAESCATSGCTVGYSCQPGASGSECFAVTPAGCTIAYQAPTPTAAETLVGGASQTVVLDPSKTFSVVVPTGTAALTLIAQGPGVSLAVTQVVDPTGATQWDWNNQPAYGPQPPSSETVFTLSGQGTYTFTLPNTSQMTTLTPGTWQLTLSASSPSSVQVSLFTKAALAATGRTVDVNMWIVSNTLSAASIQSGANAAAWATTLSTIRTLWANAGISTVNVNVLDVGADVKSQFATIDSSNESPCGGRQAMFQKVYAEASPKPSNAAVNFFLVDSITSPAGDVLGIDGAIPGPGGIAGTPVSGAIAELSFSGTSSLGQFLGYILSHEGGHFFGLFHTTEIKQNGWDPIADTPTCVGPVNCTSCVDVTNIMFPYGNCSTAGQISPEQGAVIRTSPSVY